MGSKLIILMTFVLTINITFGQSSKTKDNNNNNIKIINTNLSTTEYYDLTKALPKNHKKDGTIDYTSFIQNGINKYSKVKMPDFPVATTGLVLKSNSNLYFQKNSSLILIPTNKSRYEILRIHGVSNIKVYNPKLIGDRTKHLGKGGEWGYGIDIRGAENVTIINPSISNCWGDGIIISNSKLGVKAGKKLLSTSNITISGGVLDYNRRNGLTIIEGNKIIIENLLIKNTMGTSPQAALMIEPDNSSHEINDIIIRNITTINNPRSLAFNFNNFMDAANSKSINVSISNYSVNKSNTAVFSSGFESTGQIRGKKKILGEVIIDNLNVQNTNIPFENRNGYNLYPTIKVKNHKVTDKFGKSQGNSILKSGLKDKNGFTFN